MELQAIETLAIVRVKSIKWQIISKDGDVLAEQIVKQEANMNELMSETVKAKLPYKYAEFIEDFSKPNYEDIYLQAHKLDPKQWCIAPIADKHPWIKEPDVMPIVDELGVSLFGSQAYIIPIDFIKPEDHQECGKQLQSE